MEKDHQAIGTKDVKDTKDPTTWTACGWWDDFATFTNLPAKLLSKREYDSDVIAAGIDKQWYQPQKGQSIALKLPGNSLYDQKNITWIKMGNLIYFIIIYLPVVKRYYTD